MAIPAPAQTQPHWDLSTSNLSGSDLSLPDTTLLEERHFLSELLDETVHPLHNRQALPAPWPIVTYWVVLHAGRATERLVTAWFLMQS